MNPKREKPECLSGRVQRTLSVKAGEFLRWCNAQLDAGRSPDWELPFKVFLPAEWASLGPSYHKGGDTERILHSDLADKLGVTTATVRKYAGLARLPKERMPKRGGRNHRWTKSEARLILQAMIRESPIDYRDLALDLLKEIEA